MARPGFKEQLDTLTSRHIAIQFGAFGAIFLMFVQAPIIGYFIGLAWRNQEAAPQTYFIMSVAAVWMGCMNACTAIVQERQIYMRERMFSLNLWAYLLSKMSVLSVMGAAQSVLLLATQGQLMHLKDSMFAHVLFFVILSATNITACGLGLLISAVAQTSHGAVVAVPILLIPQAIFSEVLLQQNIKNQIPSLIEKLTLTKWCYEALVNAHKGAEFLAQTKSFLALSLALAAFLTLAAGKLKLDED
ncbi:MAG: ABC transporter permease [Elusimicrobia bacterium]|nr:ABC transporter permease [Elusimicrobiota bacterium]